MFVKKMRVKFLLFSTFLTISTSNHIGDAENNTEYFEDYDYVENFHIMSWSESKYSVADLIKLEGYPFESHQVITADGYILNLHRIPTGTKRVTNNKVAFLQHGLLSSSADWILTGAGKALAYLLADEGYDVWMGNARGNTYSRNHILLDPDTESEFWDYSWHQIGILDVPAMIDYVINETKVDGVYYVGFSEGTSVFYVMASTKPEYNTKIKVQVSLAPMAFLNHVSSVLLKVMAFWEGKYQDLMEEIGFDEFRPNDHFLNRIGDDVCTHGIPAVLCKNILFAMVGFNPHLLNITLIPTMLAHLPAGASSKQMYHHAQLVSSGHFCRYNHGRINNFKFYKSFTPPNYELSNITVPVYLIYSKNDWISTEKDVERLCSQLGNCKQIVTISQFPYNHMDFVFGLTTPLLIYKNVINILNRH